MSKTNKVLKTISAVVASAFILQSVSFAAPDIQPMQLPMFQKPMVSFELPKSVAVISDSFDANRHPERSEGSRSFVANAPQDDKMVILLQDAHTNESAQMNIARSLDLMMQKDPALQYVFLEAGTGNDSLTFLRDKADLKKRQQIGREFMRKGYLSGSEYLDLTSNHDMVLWGVEDKKLYWEAVESYGKVAQKRDKFQAHLAQVGLSIETLKPQIFGPSLSDFDAKRESYLSEKLSLTDYLDVLMKQADIRSLAITHYPHLVELSKLKEQEKAIDFNKANEEQQKAVSSLSKEDIELLKDAATGKEDRSPFKVGSSDHKIQKAYYALLEEKLVTQSQGHTVTRHPEEAKPTKDLDSSLASGGLRMTAYPELTKYFSYLKAAEKIDPKSILDEQKLLETQVYDSLIKTQDERSLHEATESLRFLKGLFNLTLTPDEYRHYKKNKDQYSIVNMTGFLNRKIMDLRTQYERVVFLEEGYEDYVKIAERYYQLTYERDFAFLENMLSKMKETNQKTSALITGGYHTPNLTALLRDKNISYVVVTPQVLQETNLKKYEQVLLSQEESHTVTKSQSHKEDRHPEPFDSAQGKLREGSKAKELGIFALRGLPTRFAMLLLAFSISVPAQAEMLRQNANPPNVVPVVAAAVVTGATSLSGQALIEINNKGLGAAAPTVTAQQVTPNTPAAIGQPSNISSMIEALDRAGLNRTTRQNYTTSILAMVRTNPSAISTLVEAAGNQNLNQATRNSIARVIATFAEDDIFPGLLTNQVQTMIEGLDIAGVLTPNRINYTQSILAASRKNPRLITVLVGAVDKNQYNLLTRNNIARVIDTIIAENPSIHLDTNQVLSLIAGLDTAGRLTPNRRYYIGSIIEVVKRNPSLVTPLTQAASNSSYSSLTRRDIGYIMRVVTGGARLADTQIRKTVSVELPSRRLMFTNYEIAVPVDLTEFRHIVIQSGVWDYLSSDQNARSVIAVRMLQAISDAKILNIASGLSPDILRIYIGRRGVATASITYVDESRQDSFDLDKIFKQGNFYNGARLTSNQTTAQNLQTAISGSPSQAKPGARLASRSTSTPDASVPAVDPQSANQDPLFFSAVGDSTGSRLSGIGDISLMTRGELLKKMAGVATVATGVGVVAGVGLDRTLMQGSEENSNSLPAARPNIITLDVDQLTIHDVESGKLIAREDFDPFEMGRHGPYQFRIPLPEGFRLDSQDTIELKFTRTEQGLANPIQSLTLRSEKTNLVLSRPRRVTDTDPSETVLSFEVKPDHAGDFKRYQEAAPKSSYLIGQVFDETQGYGTDLSRGTQNLLFANAVKNLQTIQVIHYPTGSRLSQTQTNKLIALAQDRMNNDLDRLFMNQLLEAADTQGLASVYGWHPAAQRKQYVRQIEQALKVLQTKKPNYQYLAMEEVIRAFLSHVSESGRLNVTKAILAREILEGNMAAQRDLNTFSEALEFETESDETLVSVTNYNTQLKTARKSQIDNGVHAVLPVPYKSIEDRQKEFVVQAHTTKPTPSGRALITKTIGGSEQRIRIKVRKAESLANYSYEVFVDDKKGAKSDNFTGWLTMLMDHPVKVSTEFSASIAAKNMASAIQASVFESVDEIGGFIQNHIGPRYTPSSSIMGARLAEAWTSILEGQRILEPYKDRQFSPFIDNGRFADKKIGELVDEVISLFKKIQNGTFTDDEYFSLRHSLGGLVLGLDDRIKLEDLVVAAHYRQAAQHFREAQSIVNKYRLVLAPKSKENIPPGARLSKATTLLAGGLAGLALGFLTSEAIKNREQVSQVRSVAPTSAVNNPNPDSNPVEASENKNIIQNATVGVTPGFELEGRGGPAGDATSQRLANGQGITFTKVQARKPFYANGLVLWKQGIAVTSDSKISFTFQSDQNDVAVNIDTYLGSEQIPVTIGKKATKVVLDFSTSEAIVRREGEREVRILNEAFFSQWKRALESVDYFRSLNIGFGDDTQGGDAPSQIREHIAGNSKIKGRYSVTVSNIVFENVSKFSSGSRLAEVTGSQIADPNQLLWPVLLSSYFKQQLNPAGLVYIDRYSIYAPDNFADDNFPTVSFDIEISNEVLGFGEWVRGKGNIFTETGMKVRSKKSDGKVLVTFVVNPTSQFFDIGKLVEEIDRQLANTHQLDTSGYGKHTPFFQIQKIAAPWISLKVVLDSGARLATAGELLKDTAELGRGARLAATPSPVDGDHEPLVRKITLPGSNKGLFIFVQQVKPDGSERSKMLVATRFDDDAVMLDVRIKYPEGWTSRQVSAQIEKGIVEAVAHSRDWITQGYAIAQYLSGLAEGEGLTATPSGVSGKESPVSVTTGSSTLNTDRGARLATAPAAAQVRGEGEEVRGETTSFLSPRTSPSETEGLAGARLADTATLNFPEGHSLAGYQITVQRISDFFGRPWWSVNVTSHAKPDENGSTILFRSSGIIESADQLAKIIVERLTKEKPKSGTKKDLTNILSEYLPAESDKRAPLQTSSGARLATAPAASREEENWQERLDQIIFWMSPERLMERRLKKAEQLEVDVSWERIMIREHQYPWDSFRRGYFSSDVYVYVGRKIRNHYTWNRFVRAVEKGRITRGQELTITTLGGEKIDALYVGLIRDAYADEGGVPDTDGIRYQITSGGSIQRAFTPKSIDIRTGARLATPAAARQGEGRRVGRGKTTSFLSPRTSPSETEGLAGARLSTKLSPGEGYIEIFETNYTLSGSGKRLDVVIRKALPDGSGQSKMLVATHFEDDEMPSTYDINFPEDLTPERAWNEIIKNGIDNAVAGLTDWLDESAAIRAYLSELEKRPVSIGSYFIEQTSFAPSHAAKWQHWLTEKDLLYIGRPWANEVFYTAISDLKNMLPTYYYPYLAPVSSASQEIFVAVEKAREAAQLSGLLVVLLNAISPGLAYSVLAPYSGIDTLQQANDELDELSMGIAFADAHRKINDQIELTWDEERLITNYYKARRLISAIPSETAQPSRSTERLLQAFSVVTSVGEYTNRDRDLAWTTLTELAAANDRLVLSAAAQLEVNDALIAHYRGDLYSHQGPRQLSISEIAQQILARKETIEIRVLINDLNRALHAPSEKGPWQPTSSVAGARLAAKTPGVSEQEPAVSVTPDSSTLNADKGARLTTMTRRQMLWAIAGVVTGSVAAFSTRVWLGEEQEKVSEAPVVGTTNEATPMINYLIDLIVELKKKDDISLDAVTAFYDGVTPRLYVIQPKPGTSPDGAPLFGIHSQIDDAGGFTANLTVNLEFINQMIERTKQDSSYRHILNSIIIQQGAILLDMKQNPGYHAKNIALGDQFNAAQFDVNNADQVKEAQSLAAAIVEQHAVGYIPAINYLTRNGLSAAEIRELAPSAVEPWVNGYLNLSYSLMAVVSSANVDVDLQLRRQLLLSIVALSHPNLIRAIFAIEEKRGTLTTTPTGKPNVLDISGTKDSFKFLMNPTYVGREPIPFDLGSGSPLAYLNSNPSTSVATGARLSEERKARRQEQREALRRAAKHEPSHSQRRTLMTGILGGAVVLAGGSFVWLSGEDEAQGLTKAARNDLWLDAKPSPDREGTKRLVKAGAEWLRVNRYPRMDVVDHYVGLYDTDRYVDNDQGITVAFAKQYERTAQTVEIFAGHQMLDLRLRLLQRARSQSLYIETVAAQIVREAWGLRYLEKYGKSYHDEMDAMLELTDGFNAVPLENNDPAPKLAYLKKNADSIQQRMAAIFSMEFYELLNEKDFLRWAAQKGMFSPGASEKVLSRTDQGFTDMIYRARQYYGDIDNPDALFLGLITSFFNMYAKWMASGTKGVVQVEMWVLYLLQEMGRYEDSNGAEGIDGRTANLMLRGEITAQPDNLRKQAQELKRLVDETIMPRLEKFPVSSAPGARLATPDTSAPVTTSPEGPRLTGMSSEILQASVDEPVSVRVNDDLIDRFNTAAKELDLEISLGEIEESLADFFAQVSDGRPNGSLAISLRDQLNAVLEYTTNNNILVVTLKDAPSTELITIHDLKARRERLQAEKPAQSGDELKPQDLVANIVASTLFLETVPVTESSVPMLAEMSVTPLADILNEKEFVAQLNIMRVELALAKTLPHVRSKVLSFLLNGKEYLDDDQSRWVKAFEAESNGFFLTQEQASEFNGIHLRIIGPKETNISERNDSLNFSVNAVRERSLPGWNRVLVAAVIAGSVYSGAYKDGVLAYGSVDASQLGSQYLSGVSSMRSNLSADFDDNEFSQSIEGRLGLADMRRYELDLPLLAEIAITTLLRAAAIGARMAGIAA